MHFDWNGSEEALKKFDESTKKVSEKVEGVEFMWRLSPQTMKYHWTYFYKVKDYSTWQKFGDAWFSEYKRPKELTHGEYAFFT